MTPPLPSGSTGDRPSKPTDDHSARRDSIRSILGQKADPVAPLGAGAQHPPRAGAALARSTRRSTSAGPEAALADRRRTRLAEPLSHSRPPHVLGPLRPGVKQSAGKNRGTGATGHGNRYLAKVIGEAAAGAARTDTFLGERYRRIARRRGRKKALVAVGRSILVIIWHLLANDDAQFTDLGPDFFDRRHDPERRKRAHIHQLEALGYKVTSEPVA